MQTQNASIALQISVELFPERSLVAEKLKRRVAGGVEWFLRGEPHHQALIR